MKLLHHMTTCRSFTFLAIVNMTWWNSKNNTLRSSFWSPLSPGYFGASIYRWTISLHFQSQRAKYWLGNWFQGISLLHRSKEKKRRRFYNIVKDVNSDIDVYGEVTPCLWLPQNSNHTIQDPTMELSCSKIPMREPSFRLVKVRFYLAVWHACLYIICANSYIIWVIWKSMTPGASLCKYQYRGRMALKN